MKRNAIVGAAASLALTLAAIWGLSAQQGQPGINQPSPTVPGPTAAFDSRAFFEQLRLNGVSMNEGFDGERFFEKLRLQGVSDQQPLDAQAFFEKLRLEGVAVPDSFDARKFFDDLAARGVTGPSMVAAPATGGPSAIECQAGWQAAGKWDQALFERLCQGRK
jgi:hypothetical protein